jgi:hypothetical protein
MAAKDGPFARRRANRPVDLSRIAAWIQFAVIAVLEARHTDKEEAEERTQCSKAAFKKQAAGLAEDGLSAHSFRLSVEPPVSAARHG